MRFAFRMATALGLSFALSGCASSVVADPAASRDHPANPDAPGTPMAQPSDTLAIEAGTAPTTRPHAPAHGGEMGVMPMPGMSHGDAADMPAMTTTQPTAPSAAPSTQAAVYTCPMHSEVHADHPGDCPICGMKLVKKSPAGGES